MSDINEMANSAAPAPAKLAELKRILGENTVFLPIPKGEKGPRLKCWPDFDMGQMRDQNYLKQFDEDCNVGVLTGEASDNLVSIDMDSDEALDLFLQLNPILKETAAVKGAKGAKLFVRCDPPDRGKIRNGDGEDVGDCLSDGQQGVVHGLHPDGMNYEWICENQPIELNLRDLVLPEGWTAPWTPSLEKQVAEKYGQPYEQGKTVVVGKLNESFWAGLIYGKEILLFASEEQEFYFYEPGSGLWTKASEHDLRRRVSELIYQYADAQRSYDFQESIRHKVNDAFLKGCVNRLKGIAEKVDPFKGKGKQVIHLRNGMFDLEKDELLPFSPDYYSRNQIPFDYDPEGLCPRFLGDFLQGVFDEDDVNLLQMVIGGFLLSENITQTITIIYGAAKGGKSTLERIITGLVGDSNVGNLRMKHIEGRFEMGRLLSARLLNAPDVRPDFLNNVSSQTLKAMTGGDLLDAELKGCNGSFKIHGDFNVMVTANRRPKIHLESDSDAWKRRLLVFHVEQSITGKRIPNFAEVLLKEEGNGIMLWAIRGAQRLLRMLRNQGELLLTPAQSERVETILYESDSLRVFLESEDIHKAAGKALSTEDIHHLYMQFCEEREWSPFSDTKFHARLPDLMQSIFYVAQSHSVGGSNRGYHGVYSNSMEQNSHF